MADIFDGSCCRHLFIIFYFPGQQRKISHTYFKITALINIFLILNITKTNNGVIETQNKTEVRPAPVNIFHKMRPITQKTSTVYKLFISSL